MKAFLFSALCAGTAVAAMGLAQRSGPPDQVSAITSYVDSHNAEALALLERVVNINSGTQNPDGVRAVGDVFRDQLTSLGFKTRWVEGTEWHRAGHLVAERRAGTAAAPRVLLIGHLDTVFERDSPFQRFERVGRTEARGPGVIDMKGGDVILIQALKALRIAGGLGDLDIAVVLTGDEEAPGRPLALARAALVDAARGAVAALGFEDGPGDPRFAVTSRRGSTAWTLRVSATTAHSSQIFRPDIDPGAIFETARILNGFREKLAGEEHLTFNPGLIVGGSDAQDLPAEARGSASGKDNVVAATAVVTGDLRALTIDQLERAKKTMQGIVAASLPHTQALLSFDDGYPPMPPSDGNSRLLDLYSRISQTLTMGPVAAVSPDRAGAADVSFVAGQAAMTLDGIGLMGRHGHTAQETADLTTLPSQTKRAALLLLRLSHEAAPNSNLTR
jgi:glutamate carboxypeptidase